MTNVRIQLLRNGQLPVYATLGSAGADLHAAIEEPITLEPSDRIIVPCGFIIAIPEGFEAQLRSRSGLSSKNGVIVLNSPGTIDSDYRGEIKILFNNFTKSNVVIQRGDKVAQIIIEKIALLDVEEVDDLEDTERGDKGFGSTGY